MVDITTLIPGDKIRIVDHWVDGCNENESGEMDSFLGAVVTVREVTQHCVKIFEDAETKCAPDGGWYWFPPAIAEVVDCGKNKYNPATDSELNKLLFNWEW